GPRPVPGAGVRAQLRQKVLVGSVQPDDVPMVKRGAIRWRAYCLTQEEDVMTKYGSVLALVAMLLALVLVAHQVAAQEKKPNILVIWGDDIGVQNISAYNHGIMGYKTPNIDRIAKEGAMFTDAYAQQSCTAGRASFILGQHPFRTGLLTIGMPGSPHGIPDWTPTIAD